MSIIFTYVNYFSVQDILNYGWVGAKNFPGLQNHLNQTAFLLKAQSMTYQIYDRKLERRVT